MKKIITLVVFTSLILSLTACGNNVTTNTDVTTSGTSDNETSLVEEISTVTSEIVSEETSESIVTDSTVVDVANEGYVTEEILKKIIESEMQIVDNSNEKAFKDYGADAEEVCAAYFEGEEAYKKLVYYDLTKIDCLYTIQAEDKCYVAVRTSTMPIEDMLGYIGYTLYDAETGEDILDFGLDIGEGKNITEVLMFYKNENGELHCYCESADIKCMFENAVFYDDFNCETPETINSGIYDFVNLESNKIEYIPDCYEKLEVEYQTAEIDSWLYEDGVFTLQDGSKLSVKEILLALSDSNK